MDDSLVSFIWIVVVASFVGGWIGGITESWTNAVWYAVKYSVAPNQVHTSDKPSNCDWTRSPLGNKGCHYDRVVTTFNVAGDLIAVDAAMPNHSKDKSGKPIVSYDDGKTWKWAQPTTTIKNVAVDWVKVAE